MSGTLDEIFGAEDVVATAPEQTEAPARKSSSKKDKAIRESLKATLQEDANFTNKVSTLSKSIKVINSLGFGKNGNILVDKTKPGRVLKPTSRIVGYRLQNIGTETIEYVTKQYKLDENGKYVGTTVQKTVAPGGTFDLSRVYMTMFCMRPEISFTLANGKVVAGSGGKKKGEDGVGASGAQLEAMLASHYFAFDADADGNKLEVNDDEVKISIDQDGKVKDEFIETFGNYNNPKETKKAGRVKNDKITTQVMMANYVNKLVQNAGGLD
jgi:hypothetical protein